MKRWRIGKSRVAGTWYAIDYGAYGACPIEGIEGVATWAEALAWVLDRQAQAASDAFLDQVGL